MSWLEKELKEAKRDETYYVYKLMNDVTTMFLKAMKVKNVNQSELAKRMGVSKSSVSRILSGNRNMTLETLAKMAFALDCKVDVQLKPLMVEDLEKIQIDTKEVADACEILGVA
jgi:transcriptional regulator with XRE-family HTH domain